MSAKVILAWDHAHNTQTDRHMEQNATTTPHTHTHIDKPPRTFPVSYQSGHRACREIRGAQSCPPGAKLAPPQKAVMMIPLLHLLLFLY